MGSLGPWPQRSHDHGGWWGGGGRGGVKHLETGGVCQGAGCTRGPGHRLVPHHPVAYAVDPITSLAGTVLLCERTHQDIHEGGRTILLKDGRYLGPDGWATGPSG
jgi:hypothetical protein